MKDPCKFCKSGIEKAVESIFCSHTCAIDYAKAIATPVSPAVGLTLKAVLNSAKRAKFY